MRCVKRNFRRSNRRLWRCQRWAPMRGDVFHFVCFQRGARRQQTPTTNPTAAAAEKVDHWVDDVWPNVECRRQHSSPGVFPFHFHHNHNQLANWRLCMMLPRKVMKAAMRQSKLKRQQQLLDAKRMTQRQLLAHVIQTNI